MRWACALKKMGYRRTDARELLSFDERSAYIAFSKDTTDSVVDRWSNACEQMTRDGTLSRIHRKWHVGETEPLRP
jgi:polar amino acid transport system substrate-binding protein